MYALQSLQSTNPKTTLSTASSLTYMDTLICILIPSPTYSLIHTILVLDHCFQPNSPQIYIQLLLRKHPH